jgi:hypothetical protein
LPAGELSLSRPAACPAAKRSRLPHALPMQAAGARQGLHQDIKDGML